MPRVTGNEIMINVSEKVGRIVESPNYMVHNAMDLPLKVCTREPPVCH